MNQIAPGDIYLVQDWGRPQKNRPMIVLSRPEFNRDRYIVAVPFTTSQLRVRRDLPNCVYFGKGSFGLWKACVAQADALTMLRKSDLVQPVTLVGRLSPEKLADVISAVGYVIGADCEPSLD